MQPTINKAEFITPINNSLLISCEIAYPLKVFDNKESLKELYNVILFNLGQVEKCYRKDAELIKSVKERETKIKELL